MLFLGDIEPVMLFLGDIEPVISSKIKVIGVPAAVLKFINTIDCKFGKKKVRLNPGNGVF